MQRKTVVPIRSGKIRSEQPHPPLFPTLPPLKFYHFNPSFLGSVVDLFWLGWDGVGVGVMAPATSLFHVEFFAFFDFGITGTPKILKIILQVLSKMLKKCGFCLAPPRVFAPAVRWFRPPALRTWLLYNTYRVWCLLWVIFIMNFTSIKLFNTLI